MMPMNSRQTQHKAHNVRTFYAVLPAGGIIGAKTRAFRRVCKIAKSDY